MLLAVTLTASMLLTTPVLASTYTRKDLEQAASELSAAQGEVKTLTQQATDTQEAIDKGNVHVAARQAYKAAEAERIAVEEEYQTNGPAMQEKIDSAQAAYDAKKAEFEKGMFGFYESRGSYDALSALRDCQYASYTHEGDPKDATAFDNVKPVFDLLRECNSLRASEGKAPLTVTDEAMAMAEANVNWSDTAMAHSGQFLVAENLSFGYADPYDGWYTAEKKVYDSGNTAYAATGHYQNMIDSNAVTTGFAISTDSTWPRTHGQVFRAGNPGQSVDNYEADFNAYYTSVDPAPAEAALDSAKAELKALEDKLESLRKIVRSSKDCCRRCI